MGRRRYIGAEQAILWAGGGTLAILGARGGISGDEKATLWA